MHRPHEKGTDVTPTERSPQAQHIESAGLAPLGAVGGIAGSGVSSPRPARSPLRSYVRGLIGIAAAAAGMLVLAAPALASGPPYFSTYNPLEQEIHSTRVNMRATVDANELPTEWQTALAESPNGPWKLLDSGREGGNLTFDQEINLVLRDDEPNRSGFSGIRHLTPDTSYYIRFFAKNSAGEVEKIVPFKTLPVEKPEIALQSPRPNYSHGTTFFAGATGPHSAVFEAQVETNGAQTEYHFEYALLPTGPWTPCVAGSVTVAEDFADPAVACTGLMPETTYYARAIASNVAGEVEQTEWVTDGPHTSSFATPTAKPRVEPPGVRNVTATSAHLTGGVTPRGSKTVWRFESTSSEKGPWSPIPGASGTISQAQAEALPSAESSIPVEGIASNLSPSTPYYVRLFAENECASGCGEGVNGLGEPISRATNLIAGFETSGRPLATTFATHTLHGESVRVIGAVNPNSLPTSAEQTIAIEGAPTGGTFSLTFNGQSTHGTGTGTLTSGSPTVTGIPLSSARGTGDVSLASSCETEEKGREDCVAVTDVTASVGQFRPGQAISGTGIAPGAHIEKVQGNTLILSSENAKAASGVELTSAGPSPFTVGEAISGEGIPAGTTISAAEYSTNFTATLTLSKDATASGPVEITADLPFDADKKTIEEALNNLTSVPPEAEIIVESSRPSGGSPFTVYFGLGHPEFESEGREHSPLAETHQPQIEADASGLKPSGSIAVATTQQGGVGYDSSYHFEYEPVREGIAPFSQATSTASVDAGAGAGSKIVAVDLPGLQAGASYRYRILAASESPGHPVVDGEEQTLTAPVAAAAGSGESCPNAGLRTGPSANLPDCRGYEQLTPRDKGGAQEVFHYGGGTSVAYAIPSQDGEHLVLNAEPVNWGSGPDAGHSPYFFTHTPEGWQMTAASSEPTLGVEELQPQVFAPDLTSFAFESGAKTATEVAESKEVEFRVGPPGGPYTTVARVPRQQVSLKSGEGGSLSGFAGLAGGWVAASADFSKLILQVADRALVQPASHTRSGYDLYEYAGGQLRQVNVQSNGERIGTCGARIVLGDEESHGDNTSSPHSVSADGADVFFEAIPGTECSTPSHLYERVGGTQTIDLGAVKFLAAKPDGSEVLVERSSREAYEVLLYDTGSGAATPLFTGPEDVGGEPGKTNFTVSDDLTSIYFAARAQLTPNSPTIGPAGVPGSITERQTPVNVYRYDVPARALRFLFQAVPREKEEWYPQGVGSEGRYVYFEALAVAGVPGGTRPASPKAGVNFQQAYRYDSVEGVVQCISCASPFDPEPRMASPLFQREVLAKENGPLPFETAVSANGDYAFFTTAAALVPADVDGEVEPAGQEGASFTADTSASSDVYEWRRDGLNGCTHVQGCLALITNGRGGYLTYFLGSADEGRDAFFYTSSQLVSQDNDTAGDIYDARIGGGTPAPAPPAVECEASACSTPFAAPNDLTPSSATFNGPGNPAPSAVVPAVKKKAVAKKKPKKKVHKKKNKKSSKKAKKSAKGRK